MKKYLTMKTYEKVVYTNSDYNYESLTQISIVLVMKMKKIYVTSNKLFFHSFFVYFVFFKPEV